MHIFFFCTCRHYIAAKTEAVKNVPMSPHVMYVRNEVDCFTLEKAAERASTSAPPVTLGFCRRISAMDAPAATVATVDAKPFDEPPRGRFFSGVASLTAGAAEGESSALRS